MRLLFVSPTGDEDHTVLRKMLSPRWLLTHACGLHSALLYLDTATEPFPVILCESELSPGSWREILDHVVQMLNPPLLIVASRLVDERLWAEALNAGAYDVLAEPFEAEEVNRVLTSAWLRCTRVAAMGASTPPRLHNKQMPA